MVPGHAYGSCSGTAPPAEEQLKCLASRSLANLPAGSLPIYLSGSSLSGEQCAGWPFVVVTGHVKFKSRQSRLGLNRVALHSCSCSGGPINAVLLAPGAAPIGEVPQPAAFVDSTKSELTV
eukprot:TRINITY_DN3255_c0_g2_i5.p1 TRINITY_DN3255_c0_g2~~TRINITY_DN3255_c0_g2_i5.p1  ORF type:complete len:121 (+),score=8.67 TRINITY_DN3255_c0_g2_i5:140-502(+)